METEPKARTPPSKTPEQGNVLFESSWFQIWGDFWHKSDDYRVVKILDQDLRSCIIQTTSAYIAHSGIQVRWDAVLAIESPFKLLVYSYDDLESAAVSVSTASEVAKGLRSLLDEANKLQNPASWKIPEEIENARNFHVEFDLLWAIFKPGSLIVSSCEPSKHPQIFKVHQARYKDRPPMDYQFYGMGLVKKRALLIHAWAWDWNGSELFRNMFEIQIEAYTGQKSPTELSCYPATLYLGSGNKRGISAVYESAIYQNRKENYVKYTFQQKPPAQKLLRYSGEFRGIPALSEERLFLMREADTKGFKELPYAKVDEDIVLDTVNYLRKTLSTLWLGDIRVARESIPCHCPLCLSDEAILWVESIEKGNAPFSVENELLLTPRVVGFALNRKEWGQFWLNNIEVVNKSEGAVRESRGKDLILPVGMNEDEERHIYAMVNNHSRAMARPRSQRLMDVIGKKGESLILLFHGYSGTGKTLYAESLAKNSGKPLFKVGTSDIGFIGPRAERDLKTIFELAEAWNAILLIDEADVLLDARGKDNESLVSKNALVSVLLREVEYFKAFDPAILSRIHHAVNFGEPDSNQEERIWKMWLDRLHRQGLCDDYADLKNWVDDTVSDTRRPHLLSGREIRNIFIVAQMLAEKEDGDIKITRAQVNSAYKYKKDFRHDTEKMRTEAKTLLADRKR
ncbi:hypothetical protein UA08_06032 [Talaromyces atroroseus]|uniref:AAA+ ATPase domain-containing protein n=1 Tax=Talaromyces atroroseus TaxID=1441469 RepID=A0A225AVV7_TALAT|nr:hypothetical protein UA08_06032 [Talaromyces atroroseus]OKL58565.1 hypothetical protein UA08_06032 [Talaromyces atroroseus]